MTQDGTDRWSVAANLVWNTGNHSWIRLKSPANYPTAGAGNYYLCIDLDQANDAFVIIRTSLVDWTSPSLATPGTGTQELVYTEQYRVDDATPKKWHLHTTAEGDIILYISKDGTAMAEFGMILLAFENTLSGDNYPLFEYCNYDAVAPGSFEDANLGSTLHCKGRWIDGTADCDLLLVGPQHYGSTTNALDTFDQNGDDNGGSFVAVPLYGKSALATKISWRGTLIDVRAAPSHANIPQGTTSEPSGGPVESIVVGNIWIPASATASF